MKRIIVSAPGKILLLGSYAVLERPNISYVISVNKRVFVSIKERKDKKIIFRLSQFKILKEGYFKRGQIFFRENLNEKEKEYLKFLKSATENFLNFLSLKKKNFLGFEIETFSDPAFGLGKEKSGLGASAAVVCATIGALFYFFDLKIDKEKILKLSHYAHFQAQGKIGSGFDISTVVFGSQEYVRFSPFFLEKIKNKNDLFDALNKKWDFRIRKIDFPQNFLILFGNFKGVSSLSSEMIKKVMTFKEKNPKSYKKIISDLNRANLKTIKILEKLNFYYSKNKKEYQRYLFLFKKNFKRADFLRKKLGKKSGVEIEPQKLSDLIKKTEKKGAFLATLPGAGGWDGICALCLTKEDLKRVKNFWQKSFGRKIKTFEIFVDNQGIKKEESFPP